MKRLILIFAILLLAVNAFGYGIVTNTATRDTLTIPFAALDSVGNPVNIVANDSVYIIVYYPGGGIAFRDSMAWNDASIKRFGFEDFAGCSTYAYMERVSVLDGAGVDGVYSYQLIVDDNTSASLLTSYTGQFQIVNSTLESLLDSAGLAAAYSAQAIDSLADVLDSLEAQSVWIQDSLYAIIDSIQNFATAAEVADAVWDEDTTGHKTEPNTGYWITQGGAASISDADMTAIMDSLFNRVVSDTLTNTFMAELIRAAKRSYDSLLIALDSLEALESWVAKEVTLGLAIDSINAMLDTLQLWDTRIDSLEAALADANIGDKVWTDGSFTTRAEINDVLDTLQNQDNWVANNTAVTAIRDSLQYLVTGGSGSLDSTIVSNILWRVVWGLPKGSGSDSTTYAQRVIKSVEDILDTLQNQDNWVAKEASVTAIRDTAQYLVTGAGGSAPTVGDIYAEFISGTNENAFKADVSALATTSNLALAIDSINAIIDTLQNQDDWIATLAALTAIRDSLQYLITATGFSTHSAADVWAVGTRTLTALGFTYDSTDFADSTFAVKLFATNFWAEIATRADSGNASSLTDAQMGGIADSVWQALANQYSAVAGSFGDVFYDSLDAQISSAGGVASISDADMASIIDSLFARVAADTVSGSYLAELLRTAGSGSGAGAYTRTVYVIDTVGADSPLANASVYFNNEAQTGTPFSATTNASGYAYFNIDAADWALIMNKVGYKATLDSITVSGTGTDTLETYSTFPTTTPPNQATITGTLLNARGTPYADAEVRFELIAVPDSVILTYDGAMIIQRVIYDTTDANGEYSVDVYPNDSLNDSSYYLATFYDSNKRKIVRESGWSIHIPTAAVVAFNDLTKWK